VRTGTCGALDPAFRLGDLVVVSQALSRDGTSVALGADGALQPDHALLESLLAAAGPEAHSGTIVSSDLFYDTPEGSESEWARAGARAVEMESATLFALAARRDLVAASLLVVSDLLADERRRIDAAALEKAELRMGEVALAALAHAE
jgi:purine-nucleoside phosphorylase